MSSEKLLARIEEGNFFGYVQCDLEVPEELRERFANFPPIFKNFDVGRENIGKFMLEYAEKNALLLKPQRILISSYKLNNGIVITSLLKFYLKLGLRSIKITDSLSIPHKNVSTVSYNLSLMQDENVMRIRTLALLLRL